MKVSHEVPLAYLNHSLKFNDYDYALVHLFDESEEYFRFFLDSIMIGREVILDNSAYEISISKDLQELYPEGYYDMDKYHEWILKLHPTYYILPDSKSNADATVELAKQWFDKYKDLDGIKSIGVVHGNNLEQMQKCYDQLKDMVDKLAFSFEGWWFEYANAHDIPIEWLRPLILHQLDLDHSKPHHILGCILPQEFKAYRDCKWVESIDTSAPVTNALERIYLNDKIKYKPKTTIINSFHKRWNQHIQDIMDYNVGVFRTWVK